MELLYENNLYVIFLIAGFTIFKLSLEEYQQVIVYYSLMFVIGLFSTMRLMYLLPLSFVAMFMFMEYFSSEKEKMDILISLKYKILDFLYQTFFIYHSWGVMISFFILFLSHITDNGTIVIILRCVSATVLFITFHIITKRKFKVKTFKEMYDIMQNYLFYNIHYTDELRKRFDILTCIEDNTYFDRINSYNFVTAEFLKIKFWCIKEKFRHMTFKEKALCCKDYVNKSIIVRGYSTLEMQLMRNIAVVNGWDECVIRRKIYELVYSTVFLKSLKERYRVTTRLGMIHYKEYLLYVYCHVVEPKVGNTKKKFNEFFDSQRIEEWPLEQMLVVCLGLSYRRITRDNMERYSNIIEKFNLDKDKILEYSNKKY